MSLARGLGLGDPISDVWRPHVWFLEGLGPGGPCTVGFNASWVMVTIGPPVNRQTARHEWKHYLPTTSLVGGNNISKSKLGFMWNWIIQLRFMDSLNRLGKLQFPFCSMSKFVGQRWNYFVVLHCSLTRSQRKQLYDDLMMFTEECFIYTNFVYGSEKFVTKLRCKGNNLVNRTTYF